MAHYEVNGERYEALSVDDIPGRQLVEAEARTGQSLITGQMNVTYLYAMCWLSMRQVKRHLTWEQVLDTVPAKDVVPIPDPGETVDDDDAVDDEEVEADPPTLAPVDGGGTPASSSGSGSSRGSSRSSRRAS